MLGRYELAFELFRSDVGALWVAHVASGEGAGSTVAVRRVVTKSPMTSEDTDAIAEAAFAALGLRDDHVVPILDVVLAEKEIGIVSAHVEGEPLRSLIQLAGMKRAPMPDPVAVQIALAVLDGTGVVHRTTHLAEATRCRLAGITPDGILVGADGRTLLLEVGVSGVAATVRAWSRATARVAYEAPEKLRDASSADGRADLFTVGVLLWEMLGGRRLFLGADHDTVVQRVLTGPVARADSVERRGRPAVAVALADVVERALERDPASRFQTAGEMADALRAIGEPAASAEEVAGFVALVMGDTLATRRRRLERTTAKDVAAPASPPVVAAAAGGAPAAPATSAKPESEQAAAVEPVPDSDRPTRPVDVAPPVEAAEGAPKDDAPQDDAPEDDAPQDDASEVAVDLADSETTTAPTPANAEEEAADVVVDDAAAQAPEASMTSVRRSPDRRVLWAAGAAASLGIVILLARAAGDDAPTAPVPIRPSAAVERPVPPPVPPPPRPTAAEPTPEPEPEPAPSSEPTTATAGDASAPRPAPKPPKKKGAAAAPARVSPKPPAPPPKKFTPKGI